MPKQKNIITITTLKRQSKISLVKHRHQSLCLHIEDNIMTEPLEVDFCLLFDMLSLGPVHTEDSNTRRRILQLKGYSLADAIKMTNK